jgi:hypothetical protein
MSVKKWYAVMIALAGITLPLVIFLWTQGYGVSGLWVLAPGLAVASWAAFGYRSSNQEVDSLQQELYHYRAEQSRAMMEREYRERMLEGHSPEAVPPQAFAPPSPVGEAEEGSSAEAPSWRSTFKRIAVDPLRLAVLVIVVWLTERSLRNILQTYSTTGHLGPGHANDIIVAMSGTAALITAVGLAVARILGTEGGRRRNSAEGEAAVILAKAELRRADAEYLRAKKGLPPLPPRGEAIDPGGNGLAPTPDGADSSS